MRHGTKPRLAFREIASDSASLHGSRSRWPPSFPCKCISRGLLGAALLHVKARACSRESAEYKRSELEFKYFLPGGLCDPKTRLNYHKQSLKSLEGRTTFPPGKWLRRARTGRAGVGLRGKAAVSWIEINEGDSAWVTRTRFSRGILESVVKLQSAAQSAVKFTMRTGATGEEWSPGNSGVRSLLRYYRLLRRIRYITTFASSDLQTSFTFNPRERSLIGFIGRRQSLGVKCSNWENQISQRSFPFRRFSTRTALVQ